MVDNNSSSNVATIAIVVLVIFAGAGLYYFMKHGGLKEETSSTNIEVTIPKPADNTKTPANTDQPKSGY